jgi:hypothetical protein
MKFKELPAFETNEFKVGDRVKVYTENGILLGIVSSDRNKGYHYVFILKDGTEEEVEFHFKQCRNLEPVKPREFLIKRCDGEDDDMIFEYDSLIREGFIWVREVLEDEI